MRQKWSSVRSHHEKKSDDINTVWEHPVVIVKKINPGKSMNTTLWTKKPHNQGTFPPDPHPIPVFPYRTPTRSPCTCSPHGGCHAPFSSFLMFFFTEVDYFMHQWTDVFVFYDIVITFSYTLIPIYYAFSLSTCKGSTLGQNFLISVILSITGKNDLVLHGCGKFNLYSIIFTSNNQI